MDQPLHGLCGAGQPAGAAAHHFAFRPHGQRAAYGAMIGEMKKRLPFGRWLTRWGRTKHLRNNIACALDIHKVTFAHVLAGNLVFIVQGGAGYKHPANVNRFQMCNRGQGTGAPDLNFYGVQARNGLFCGNFHAMAQRGARPAKPRRSCRPRSSIL